MAIYNASAGLMILEGTDFTVSLNELDWVTSSAGKYYCIAYIIDTTKYNYAVSVSICNFQSLRADDNIIPYIYNNSSIALMSNDISNYTEYSKISIRVLLRVKI